MPMQDPQFDDDQYLDEYNQGFDGRSLPGMGPSMSFGERIGAKKMPVQPTPDAAQAKVEDTQAPPQLQLDPQKLPPEITRTTLKPSEIPTPAASSPVTNTLPDLMRRRSDAAKPIDPGAVDPVTKKPMYRMGTGQRVLGTIANALNGFSRNGAPVVDVGPGATNNRYSRAVGMQEKQLGALDTDIGNQEKLGEQQRKLYEDATKQAYEGELGEARLQTADAATARAKAAGETADVKSQLVESQRQLNEARARKADAPEEPKTEPEIALAYQTAVLKGDKAAAAKYKGALDMLAKQKAAGKDTSASDLQKYLQVSEFKIKQHASIDNEAEQERQKRYAEIDNDKSLAGMDRKLDPTGQKAATAKAAVDQEIAAKYKPKHDNVETEAQGMLGLTKTGQKVNKAPKPAASANQGRVSVVEKATGKRGTIPKEQLQSALASGRFTQ